MASSQRARVGDADDDVQLRLEAADGGDGMEAEWPDSSGGQRPLQRLQKQQQWARRLSPACRDCALGKWAGPILGR